MPSLRSALRLLACTLVVSSGCGWAKRKPYDNDPLVRHQRPVMGPLPANTGALSTPVEPYPPPRPLLPADPSYVHGGVPPGNRPPPGRPAPETVSQNGEVARDDLPGPPASPARPKDEVVPVREALPTPRPLPESLTPMPDGTGERPQTQVYGHAPDYRWLQGTLDIHHRGFRALRYADPGEEDPWGGKVRLVEDDRLKAFADGDVLRMEGTLIGPQPNEVNPTQGYPLYRIQSIQCVLKSGFSSR